jgi:hypothetical protein
MLAVVRSDQIECLAKLRNYALRHNASVHIQGLDEALHDYLDDVDVYVYDR